MIRIWIQSNKLFDSLITFAKPVLGVFGSEKKTMELSCTYIR